MPAKRWHMLGVICLPALICFESCGLKDRAQTETDPVVVQIGKWNYSKADLEQFFDSRLSEFRGPAATDEEKSAMLDSFIEEKLLLQEAEELKIEPSPKTLDSMRDKLSASGGGSSNDLKRDKDVEQSMADSLKVQAYMRDHLFKGVSVTKEECEAYYKEHLGDFVSNDVVHVREILVDSAEEAQKIQALLKANRNRNFKDLARLYSKAPTASDGGDLGTFQRGELPEEFEKAIFPLASGTISRIVSSQYGYHTFFVEEKILAHQQKFYEVEGQIQEKLLQQRQRAALEKELESLAQKVPIQVDHEKLDFKYVGARFAPRGGKSQ
ncbi:MAG: peptidylprolyl isomerase [Acidobacteriia bacterium]|nr:peptidylprolyl isomerase [Terriglobia bacterium]